jgi:hypothetical protein
MTSAPVHGWWLVMNPDKAMLSKHPSCVWSVVLMMIHVVFVAAALDAKLLLPQLNIASRGANLQQAPQPRSLKTSVLNARGLFRPSSESNGSNHDTGARLVWFCLGAEPCHTPMDQLNGTVPKPPELLALMAEIGRGAAATPESECYHVCAPC